MKKIPSNSIQLFSKEFPFYCYFLINIVASQTLNYSSVLPEDYFMKLSSKIDQGNDCKSIVLWEENNDPKLQPFRTINFEGGIICTIKQSHQSGIGTGGIIWPAAEALAEYFVVLDKKTRGYWRQKSVIELGSGTGLVGLVLHHLGAKVTLTDQDVMIPLLSDNARLNRRDKSCKVFPKVEICNWGSSDCNRLGKFDYIVGSDISYHPKLFPLLTQTLEKLSSEKTTIFLSHTNRYISRTNQFFEALKTNGYSYKSLNLDDISFVSQPQNLYILLIHKNKL